MSLIGSVSNLFQRPMPADIDPAKLSKALAVDSPEFAGTPAIKAPPSASAPSFGSLLDNAVGEVNAKANAAGAEQAKVLSGESTNLHQAMISIQEAGVAFSLMVEVRNKLVDSYQELMRMQI